jgi:ankyrin repeat protein
MCPASSAEVQVEYWVDKGADVTGADYDKRTPLHIAAADGHLKVVKFLVRKGASVNAEDRCGRLLLHHLLAAPCRRAGGATALLRSSTSSLLASTGVLTQSVLRYLQVWRHAHVRRHPREALRHHELPAGQGRRKARDGD